MLIIAAVAGMALVVGRSARVESMTSANHVASARAGAVERAAEQYVIALAATQRETVMTLDASNFEAVPVGDAGAFWIVRPDYGDSSLPLYGLVDEASKLHLNTATRNMLHRLASMPDVLPDSIFDWRDDDENAEGQGVESQYYQNTFGYAAKNANFEAVEELMYVQGATPELIFGSGAPGGMLAANSTGGLGGGLSIGGMSENDMLARGLLQYLTVYSREPNPNNANNARVGRVNVNTASREVLGCVSGLSGTELDALLQKRTFGGTETRWYTETVRTGGQLISGQSYQFSADIVAASRDGRSFRRVRIVVDAYDQNNAPKVIYRNDLTRHGWPLDPNLLASMRSGTWSGQQQMRRG